MSKQQATSRKRQAASDLRLSKTAMAIHEAWCVKNGYKQQASSGKLRQNVARYNSSDYKASSAKRV